MKNTESEEVYVYLAIPHEFPILYYFELMSIMKTWSKVVFSRQICLVKQKEIKKVPGILLSVIYLSQRVI